MTPVDLVVKLVSARVRAQEMLDAALESGDDIAAYSANGAVAAFNVAIMLAGRLDGDTPISSAHLK